MSTLENYPRITPFLWFDANAEEAVNFYLTVFKNGRRTGELKSDEAPHTPKVSRSPSVLNSMGRDLPP